MHRVAYVCDDGYAHGCGYDYGCDHDRVLDCGCGCDLRTSERVSGWRQQMITMRKQ